MQTAKDESFKKTIAILIAIVTALAAVIAFLQSDAGARDDRANRDTKNYALEALGRQVSGDARVNYDYNTAYQAWYELDLLAASAANLGCETEAIMAVVQVEAGASGFGPDGRIVLIESRPSDSDDGN